MSDDIQVENHCKLPRVRRERTMGMKSALHYLIGDATKPVKLPAMLPHVCNDTNSWGRGYVLALRAAYPKSEQEYHRWFNEGDVVARPCLGDVQFVRCTDQVTVANMIAQHGTRWEGKVPPIRYDALRTALERVYASAMDENVTVHMPRIGADLAGGKWSTIEKIIEDTMTVDTFVYTLESQKDKWPTEYETWPM